jgi:hypothetical protein
MSRKTKQEENIFHKTNFETTSDLIAISAEFFDHT